MTSSVLIVLLLSLAINAAVGGYFRILAKNQYEPVAFNFWAASCLVYCLGLVGSALTISAPSINVLSTLTGLLYLTASYLLLHGFLSFNIQCVHSTVKRTGNRVFVIAVLFLLGAFWYPKLVEPATSFFIALMFLYCFQSFQSQQWKTIKGVSVLIRSILFIHFIIMMIRALLTTGATYYGLVSNLQVFITITVGLHVLLCLATSALLPFIILSKEKGEWEAMANFDELTGVLGRRAFIRTVLKKLKPKSKRSFTLLVIDIDFFKTINDSYGHPEGDRVLKNVAQCLQAQLRDGDIVGRLGGEEFGVIISHRDFEHPFTVADRLRESVSSLVISSGSEEIKVTISVGMSSSSNVEDTWNTLFNRADKELYNAKKTGRNRVSPEVIAETTLV